MVDEGRVVRLLRSLDERVARLRESAEAADERHSAQWLDAVKYQLITAVECTVDVAHHFTSSEGWGSADSNAAALRLMGDHGVIDDELARSLARAVGFRNVLVHRYVDVDDAVVVDALTRLADFDRFVTQVGRWLDDNR